MESDYTNRLVAVVLARCLLEWATASKSPAIVLEGSKPSAPIRNLRRRLSRVGYWASSAVCLAVRLVRWVLSGVSSLVDLQVNCYRFYSW